MNSFAFDPFNQSYCLQTNETGCTLYTWLEVTVTLLRCDYVQIIRSVILTTPCCTYVGN